MTMPKTAALMKESPSTGDIADMTDEKLAHAVALLQDDLPGDPIGFIDRVGPDSTVCDCGAVHLRVNDRRLDAATYTSLMRVLATPFGDIVREHFRRQYGWGNIRFGWDGLDGRAPTFMATVHEFGVASTNAADIPHEHLRGTIRALHHDLADVMAVIEQAAKAGESAFVPPEPGDEGRAHWFELTAQLMFVFATPLRKYVVEWYKREYGVNVGAVNCCGVVVGRTAADGTSGWSRELLATQIGQQLTPDC
ncbi:MAG: hypothetical protein AAF467_09205 [Actinomycetota bacterium]